MALTWSLAKGTDMVMVSVRGRAVLSRDDFDDYLTAMNEAGYKGFQKLMDLRGAHLDLTRDDIEAISARLLQFDRVNGPGMIAVVVDTPLLLDMMVLVKQRVEGHRSFRIFVELEKARDWLWSTSRARALVRSYPAASLP